ncbi:MAG TPA: chemotaxis protein CheX [Desulfuromonadaceae bacterium]
MVHNPSNLPEGPTGDELVRLLAEDIREVFSTMVDMEALLHLPMQIDAMTQFENCVTAMVGLAGTYNGVVSLHAPLRQALAMTTGMLGVQVTEFNEDVCDAVGEIANMVAGSFKQHLSRGGSDIRLSTPSVITGTEYTVAAQNPEDTITLHFATNEDWFVASATFEKE